MGRAERRRLERTERIENRKSKLLVTRKDLKDMRMSVSRDNVKVLMACFALAEHRLYGYGRKRCVRTLNYVDKMMGDILDGTSSFDDYINELRDDVGVIIKY